MAALGAHAPDIARAARRSVERGRTEGRRHHPDPIAFAAAPSDSVNYSVIEKATKVAVVPVEMGWSDIESGDALHEYARKDEFGNASFGDVAALDMHNCLMRSEGPLVAALASGNLIVVATPDTSLILPRSDNEKVKRAVERLKRDGHVTLDRPFGYRDSS